MKIEMCLQSASAKTEILFKRFGAIAQPVSLVNKIEPYLRSVMTISFMAPFDHFDDASRRAFALRLSHDMSDGFFHKTLPGVVDA